MSEARIESLSGSDVLELFAGATAWLEAHVEQVNSLNVFPVPDGDTGTNMFLTMRAVMEEAGRCAEPGAGPMLAAMAHGALMGARGNSGVILSQIIRGMSDAAEGAETLTAEGFAAGLEAGSASAYRAVTKPVEGTILTVIRESSEAGRLAAAGGERDIAVLLASVVSEAQLSVNRTPTLMPLLAEAGVVDSGGLGLSLILEGMLRHLNGQPVDDAVSGEGAVEQRWLAATDAHHQAEDSPYGYCTELLISGSDLNVDEIRGRIKELGDSVLVVGDPQLVRVHVHTDNPGAALSTGTEAGSLAQVKVDNIRRQAERFVEMHEARQQRSSPEPGAISTVAVVAGDGMVAVFESVGCTRIVSGGPTMNPSTREIVEAVDACPTEDVIVLPNDKNIILAAQQVAGLTKKRAHVLESRSMPQGIAALLTLNYEDDVDANVGAMGEAMRAVRTVEVTRAVKSTSVGGVRVKEGDIIGIVDDELTLTESSADGAVLRALEGIDTDKTSLITLYHGGETTASAASDLAVELRRRFPGHEVEVVYGGQPHYDYVASIE